MDDSFTFRTVVPLRRRIDPRAVKAGVFLLFVALGVGLFANWVMTSERESFARADRRETASEIAVTQIQATAPLGTDAEAMEAARMTLTAARAAFTEHGSFADADPARLTALQPGYIFVDGPSTMPRVVSIAATHRSFAAAVMGPAGTCYWIRSTEGEAVGRGTASECTGAAALIARPQGW
jgi:hypothetical protein